MTLELTAEERAGLSSNAKILVAWLEAYERGDKAESDRLFSALEIPAHALMAIKETRGADWIRSPQPEHSPRRREIWSGVAGPDRTGPQVARVGRCSRLNLTDETNRRHKVMISEFTDEERAALSENSQLILAMMEAEDRGDMAEADRLLSKVEGPRPHAHGDQERTGGRRLDPQNEPEHPPGR